MSNTIGDLRALLEGFENYDEMMEYLGEVHYIPKDTDTVFVIYETATGSIIDENVSLIEAITKHTIYSKKVKKNSNPDNLPYIMLRGEDSVARVSTGRKPKKSGHGQSIKVFVQNVGYPVIIKSTSYAKPDKKLDKEFDLLDKLGVNTNYVKNFIYHNQALLVLFYELEEYPEIQDVIEDIIYDRNITGQYVYNNYRAMTDDEINAELSDLRKQFEEVKKGM